MNAPETNRADASRTLDASTSESQNPPVACDMTGAPDTGPERLAEYARLFDAAYLSRERDDTGVRWLLRAAPGIEEWAGDLAGRENACCAFMTNTITRDGDLVIWHATTIDDPTARATLDLFYDLPTHRLSSMDEVYARWSATGTPILVREGDVTRSATAAEIRDGRRRAE